MASPGSVVIQFIAKADDAARDVAGLAKKLVGLDAAADTVDSSLRNAQTAISQTGTSAQQTAPDLQRAETALDQLADEGDLTAQRLRTSAANMADGMRQGSVGITTETDNIKTQVGEVGRETGAEFIGNIAEGIGSGSASLTDVVSGTLGGITNLAASLTGPLGLAAAGAAAGVGLVFQAVKAEAEQAKLKIDAVVTALQGVDDRGSEIAEDKIFQSYIDSASQVPGKVEKIQSVLAEAQVTAEEFQAAIAGDPKAIDTVTSKIQKQGSHLQKIKNTGGELTAGQEEYLRNTGMILGDVKDWDDATGGARRQYDAIDALMGKAPMKQKKVTEETEDTAEAARGFGTDMDHATRDRSMRVTVHTVTPNGNPYVPPSTNVFPRAAGQQAAPVTVNVWAPNAGRVPNSARELIALLEGANVRMGRTAREARAVAW